MKVTTNGLIRASGIAALAAGLLFVVIQPLHPADVLTSATTPAWSIIHQATCLMLVLFLAGLHRHLRQPGRRGRVARSRRVHRAEPGAPDHRGVHLRRGVHRADPRGDVTRLRHRSAGHGRGRAVQPRSRFTAEYLLDLSALFLGGCIVFGIATIRPGSCPVPRPRCSPSGSSFPPP